MAKRQAMMKTHLPEGATTSNRSLRETHDALYALTTLGQTIQREAERRLYEEVTVRTSAELRSFHRALADGNMAERSAAIRSFVLDWPRHQALSVMDVVHLACILCKLTAVEHLQLPVVCTSYSIFAYDTGPSAGKVRPLLPPSMFLDLFQAIRPQPHLRVLDVTLELLIRIPPEALRHVECLSLHIEAHEQPRACSAVSWLFGNNLRSLRILRSCFGQYPGPQESPARICAVLDLTGLTYLELRDIDVLGTCTAESVDALANTEEGQHALHTVPALTTIVWEPCWARRGSKGEPSYHRMVRAYSEDLLKIFGEELVFLCEDGSSARPMGRELGRSIPPTKAWVEHRWRELDSWGELSVKWEIKTGGLHL